MSLSLLTKTMNRDICTFLVIEITQLQFLTKNNSFISDFFIRPCSPDSLQVLLGRLRLAADHALQHLDPVHGQGLGQVRHGQHAVAVALGELRELEGGQRAAREDSSETIRVFLQQKTMDQ